MKYDLEETLTQKYLFSVQIPKPKKKKKARQDRLGNSIGDLPFLSGLRPIQNDIVVFCACKDPRYVPLTIVLNGFVGRWYRGVVFANPYFAG